MLKAIPKTSIMEKFLRNSCLYPIFAYSLSAHAASLHTFVVVRAPKTAASSSLARPPAAWIADGLRDAVSDSSEDMLGRRDRILRCEGKAEEIEAYI